MSEPLLLLESDEEKKISDFHTFLISVLNDLTTARIT